MTFYERLIKETEHDKQRFFSRKIISTVLQNPIEKNLYIEYLAQAYHHVRFTCPLFRHAITKMDPNQDKSFIDAFEEYIEEEEGHEEWILNDIEFMGGNKDKVRKQDGDLPVQSMIAYMYHTINSVTPYTLLGMVHVLEGTSVNIATEAAEAIAKSMGIDTRKGFSYLMSHGKLDISHVDFFIQLVNKIEDKTIQDQIIKTAKMIYFLWGNMFDEVQFKFDQQIRLAA
jgi:pyrroloquinoline quinone (PQQ) biosynthesis protein C